jgi:hypothetical protein
MVQRKCKACGGCFSPRPQNPEQQFCSKRVCQRERKRRWQQRKRATDADYRDNQAQAGKRWAQAHPDYWRRYRRDHPDYTASNRALQRERDRRRRQNLAKMDASGGKTSLVSGRYWLIPEADQASVLAKMDACRVQLTVLPEGSGDCPILQRDDSMGVAAVC